MAEQNYSAVDFNVLPSASDGKTLLYAEGQVCKSEKDLGELIGEETSGKLDTTAFASVSSDFVKQNQISAAEWNAATDTLNANSGSWITNTVDDLVNYYTSEKVDEKLANFGGFKVVQLDEETEEPDVENPSTKTIYLTKDDTVTGNDKYNEWIYTSADAQHTYWEKIGDTTIDLSNYLTKTSADTLYAPSGNYITSAQLHGEDGIEIRTSSDGLYIALSSTLYPVVTTLSGLMTTAKPLTGTWSLKCINGTVQWVEDSNVPANAAGVNGEPVGVNGDYITVGEGQ